MDAIARAVIEKRVAELERERDTLIQQANQQVSAYAGAIGELKRLLEPPKPEIAEHPQRGPDLPLATLSDNVRPAKVEH